MGKLDDKHCSQKCLHLILMYENIIFLEFYKEHYEKVGHPQSGTPQMSISIKPCIKAN